MSKPAMYPIVIKTDRILRKPLENLINNIVPMQAKIVSDVFDDYETTLRPLIEEAQKIKSEAVNAGAGLKHAIHNVEANKNANINLSEQVDALDRWLKSLDILSFDNNSKIHKARKEYGDLQSRLKTLLRNPSDDGKFNDPALFELAMRLNFEVKAATDKYNKQNLIGFAERGREVIQNLRLELNKIRGVNKDHKEARAAANTAVKAQTQAATQSSQNPSSDKAVTTQFNTLAKQKPKEEQPKRNIGPPTKNREDDEPSKGGSNAPPPF